MANISLIEDDAEINRTFQHLLEKEGHKVTSFPTGDQFILRFKEGENLFDLVLCNYRLPDTDGVSVYTIARDHGLHCPFILMSAFDDLDFAVKAMKAGVADYLVKPVQPQALLQKITTYAQPSLNHEVVFNRFGRGIITKSPEMEGILQKLSRTAESKASILLMGESGTGKEVISRMLHDISSRSLGQFVPVNVSAVPDTLFEAEFFGYKKGAFTDAVRDHEGFARMANQGTLFLDEIGEMSPSSQAKLLRLLEDKKVQPLGSKEIYPVDFRLISATNKALPVLVREGKFRDDLYYRLAVISVSIPPLRMRPEDIIPLARHLLAEIAKDEELDILDFTSAAKEVLLSYRWPGNVRELKNRIHEAVLATDDRWVDVPHLNLPITLDTSVNERPMAYLKAKARFEKRYTIRMLRATHGNINRVAELSGLSRKAIYDFMKRHNIDLSSFRK